MRPKKSRIISMKNLITLSTSQMPQQSCWYVLLCFEFLFFLSFSCLLPPSPVFSLLLLFPSSLLSSTHFLPVLFSRSDCIVVRAGQPHFHPFRACRCQRSHSTRKTFLGKGRTGGTVFVLLLLCCPIFSFAHFFTFFVVFYFWLALIILPCLRYVSSCTAAKMKKKTCMRVWMWVERKWTGLSVRVFHLSSSLFYSLCLPPSYSLFPPLSPLSLRAPRPAQGQIRTFCCSHRCLLQPGML